MAHMRIDSGLKVGKRYLIKDGEWQYSYNIISKNPNSVCNRAIIGSTYYINITAVIADEGQEKGNITITIPNNLIGSNGKLIIETKEGDTQNALYANHFGHGSSSYTSGIYGCTGYYFSLSGSGTRAERVVKSLVVDVNNFQNFNVCGYLNQSRMYGDYYTTLVIYNMYFI